MWIQFSFEIPTKMSYHGKYDIYDIRITTDDNVLLCLPKIFNKIHGQPLMNGNLCYKWQEKNGSTKKKQKLKLDGKQTVL